jgi:DNA-binding winged helix-turn-helix (wHTH) protein
MLLRRAGGGVRYRFDGFTLDHDTRQLLSNGDEVHLSPKAFDLLALLVANRARAVSKVELQERLWPSTFVEETNLATLAAEVRRALRDSAASPRFVRTVYGFGYRFVAEVSADRGGLGPDSAHATLSLVFERRPIPLVEGANVIGRAADSAIPIDSPGMSRYHARIVVAGGEAILEDLGSKNGTHLNGARVTKECPLADGDQIRLGTVVMTFRNASPMSPTETVPADFV